MDIFLVPQITQSYIVPPPTSYAMFNNLNDVAVYSMWEHFLDVCANCNPNIPTPRKIPLLNPYAQTNTYTGKKRLNVFVQLSQQGT